MLPMAAIPTALIAFTAAAGLLTVTPGLDTALVLRTATAEGPRHAALAGLGIVSACFGWAIMVALGLGALLAASALAYTVLRAAGALYLLATGVRLLARPRRGLADSGAAAPAGRHAARAAFARGALTNLLNPKVGIFYVSFLPQFVPAGVPLRGFILLLGAIHALLGALWFASLILATQPIARWLRRPGIIAALDRMTGTLFIGFGAALALRSR
jgi:threonine/homoserine/homoserine lactone efflux protein